MVSRRKKNRFEAQRREGDTFSEKGGKEGPFTSQCFVFFQLDYEWILETAIS